MGSVFYARHPIRGGKSDRISVQTSFGSGRIGSVDRQWHMNPNPNKSHAIFTVSIARGLTRCLTLRAHQVHKDVAHDVSRPRSCVQRNLQSLAPDDQQLQPELTQRRSRTTPKNTTNGQ